MNKETPISPNENRNFVVGEVIDEKPHALLVKYISEHDQEVERWIPNACIYKQVTNDDGTYFYLQDGEMSGIQIACNTFVFGSDGQAVWQDAHDLWVEEGIMQDASVVVEEEEVDVEEEVDDNPFAGLSAAVTEDSNPFAGLSATVTTDDDFDDSVPNFDGQAIDVAQLQESTEKTEARKKKAVSKAAQLREQRYADSKDVKDNFNSDISKAFADGKRHEDFGAWNFDAEFVELEMSTTDPITGEKSYTRLLDSKDNPRLRAVVNPTITSEEEPLGVVLNPRVGANYEIVQHPTVFKPVIQAIRGINEANGCVYQLDDSGTMQLVSGDELLSWDAWSFKQGGRAQMNVDITGLANKTRKDAAAKLSNYGYVNLSANRIDDMLVEEEGGHRVGVSIMNAHDGKSALQALMTFLRTYCGNLAMRGGVSTIMKHRHTTGSIALYDPQTFADSLVASMVDARKTLIAMSVCRWLPIETNMFDKMLTVFNKHGLCPQPSATVQAGDLNQFQDKDGKIVLTGKLHSEAVKIAGGHAMNAIMSGWMNPDESYIAMNETEADKEAQGTMFHALQCSTGTLTHNPVWSDGKRTLEGKKQGIETLMKRSVTATDIFEKIAKTNLQVYAEATGLDNIDDLPAMKQWFKENPDKLVVPTSSKSDSVKPLVELPAFADTWKVTVPKVTVSQG